MFKKILNNKIFKFVFGFIETVLFIGLVLYVGFVVCQRLCGNKSILGHKVFTVVTGSMVPIYGVDDIILVQDTTIDELSVGDDVAYVGNRGSFQGKTVVHRIVRIEETSNGGYVIFTQGVNNEVEDPSINPEQIVGKVVRKIYSISFINHVIKNVYGFFFLIFCPFVLIICIEIAQTAIEKKEDKEKSYKEEKRKHEAVIEEDYSDLEENDLKSVNNDNNSLEDTDVDKNDDIIDSEDLSNKEGDEENVEFL